MISKLRMGTTGFGTANSSMKTSIPSSSSVTDRTSFIQQAMRSNLQSAQHRNTEPSLLVGPIPRHFDGRGHLEGSCMAKQEGLLENKGQKICRKRKEKSRSSSSSAAQKKRKKEKYGEEDIADDYSDSDEDEEEERKVWRPVSSAYTNIDSSNQQGKNRQEKHVDIDTLNRAIENDIQSLVKADLEWSKTNKFGKRSNENFSMWLDFIGHHLHARQTVFEDCIFDSM